MLVKERIRFVGPAPSLEIHVDSSGRVYWSHDWRRMDDLVSAGYLSCRNYGPDTYGHVEYFLPEETEAK